MDDYDRGGHTKYCMMVHIIFVTKYRKNIFTKEDILNSVKYSLYTTAKKYGYFILQMEADKDHIHLLVKYKPSTSVSVIAGQLKQHSTYYMWKHYTKILSRHYWKRSVLWSDGFFACSIGQVSKETIEKYIQSQG